ncbi:MAG: hypothetical protein FWC73_10035 [Defluviitaleaceae bacterium]|nr:hypothetical protein [Defluviitaleaceae bacterium]
MQDLIQYILGGAGNIASFMTIAVTLMGAAALLLSNLARYTQAKKYGIPIKAVSQATMGDSAAIWILLIRAVGLGVFVPLLLFNSGTSWPWWAVLPVILLSFYCALTANMTWRHITRKKKEFKGKTYIVEKDAAYMYSAGFTAMASMAYLPVRGVYQHIYIDGGERIAEGFLGHSMFFLGAIVLGLYVLILANNLYFGIQDTLLGGKESMVVEIEGQTYVVAMRNSHYHWILVPCEPDVVVLKRYKSGNYSTQAFLRFSKGKFIVRDMSTLNVPIQRLYNYSPVDMGVPEESVRDY